ncbi:Uncharacterized protein TCM_002551 [Theobroma cacao]|uniref:Uncharacterized protein n=1 Tax=Theobroma cacao TaxID=3641 RepID=A0A061DLY4_THECC|nr:Uncharacterized protein TCM_002551 [Theobroma cacao]
MVLKVLVTRVIKEHHILLDIKLLRKEHKLYRLASLTEKAIMGNVTSHRNAIHFFVSPHFASNLGIEHSKMEQGFLVTTPLREKFVVEYGYLACMI